LLLLTLCPFPSAQLFLGFNDLTGTLPTEVGLLKLSSLSVFRNDLEGTLPGELWQLSAIKRINISGCSFSGTISNLIGNFRALQELHFDDNRFSGSIPLLLGLLTNLGM